LCNHGLREANAARRAKGRALEVIGAWPFRMKVKQRKAFHVHELAAGCQVLCESGLKSLGTWSR
jgi:hypothetical protein